MILLDAVKKVSKAVKKVSKAIFESEIIEYQVYWDFVFQ